MKSTFKFVFNRDILKPNMGFPSISKTHNPIGFSQFTQWKEYNDLCVSQQKTKFQNFFSKSNNTLDLSSKILKKLIRKGIPPEYRGEIWFVVSGAKTRMKRGKGIYEECVLEAKREIRKKVIDKNKNKRNKDNRRMVMIDYIDNDIERTYPELKWFQDKKNLDRLRNILLAYSIYKQDIGYCQGLNFVAGIFLYFMNNEEKAFWTMDACLEKYLPHDFYNETLNGVYCESYVLYNLMKDRRKGVFDKLEKMRFSEPEYAIFTSTWFMSLFLTILPIQTALRVLDCFLMEGNKILFRVAITILTESQKIISININEKGEMINEIKMYCSTIYHVQQLLEVCD